MGQGDHHDGKVKHRSTVCSWLLFHSLYIEVVVVAHRQTTHADTNVVAGLLAGWLAGWPAGRSLDLAHPITISPCPSPPQFRWWNRCSRVKTAVAGVIWKKLRQKESLRHSGMMETDSTEFRRQCTSEKGIGGGGQIFTK